MEDPEIESTHLEQPYVEKQETNSELKNPITADGNMWRDFTVKYTVRTPYNANVAEIYASAPTAQATIEAFEFLYAEVQRITLGLNKEGENK